MESHHRSFPLFRSPFETSTSSIFAVRTLLAREDIPHAMPLDDPPQPTFCNFVSNLTPPYSFLLSELPYQLSTLLLSCGQFCKTLLADHCPQPEVAGSGFPIRVIPVLLCSYVLLYPFIPQITTAFEFFLVGGRYWGSLVVVRTTFAQSSPSHPFLSSRHSILSLCF